MAIACAARGMKFHLEITAELAEDRCRRWPTRDCRHGFLLGLLDLCREMIEDGEPPDRIADYLGLAQLVAMSLRPAVH